MQNQPKFVVYVLFSEERGPSTLHEPMTFSNEEEARQAYDTFPLEKVTLRKDMFMEHGTVLHENLNDSPKVAIVEPPQVPISDKEAVVKSALETFDRNKVIETIIDAMSEDAPFLLNPEEFFAEGEYGHLQRSLTAREITLRRDFQVAGDHFFLEWLHSNMTNLSNDQIYKTLAWHSDKDLGEKFWPSLVARLKGFDQ